MVMQQYPCPLELGGIEVYDQLWCDWRLYVVCEVRYEVEQCKYRGYEESPTYRGPKLSDYRVPPDYGGW